MSSPKALPDSELSHLFARYPDINFDFEGEFKDAIHGDEHFSSPCSNGTDQDESNFLEGAASSAHTTPMLLSPQSRQATEFESPNITTFLDNVARAHLAQVAKEGFVGLANSVARLGALLLNRAEALSGRARKLNKKEICRHSMLFQGLLEQCLVYVSEQVANISYIKTLAPFTVTPAQQDLWCNYRQKAHLVFQYVAPPCLTEQNLLEDLAHLFDAYVYNPFLQLQNMVTIDVGIQGRINENWDLIMTLLHSYRVWWNGMREIRQEHMLPLLRQIKRSPEPRPEADETGEMMNAAETVAGRLESPQMHQRDE